MFFKSLKSSYFYRNNIMKPTWQIRSWYLPCYNSIFYIVIQNEFKEKSVAYFKMTIPNFLINMIDFLWNIMKYSPVSWITTNHRAWPTPMTWPPSTSWRSLIWTIPDTLREKFQMLFFKYNIHPSSFFYHLLHW